jgi:hypothetical protein
MNKRMVLGFDELADMFDLDEKTLSSLSRNPKVEVEKDEDDRFVLRTLPNTVVVVGRYPKADVLFAQEDKTAQQAISKLTKIADTLDHAGKEKLADLVDRVAGLLTKKSNTWQEEQEQLAEAISKFPSTFGLREFPGKSFRISPESSFVSDGKLMIYTQILRDGTWLDFAKEEQGELRRQIIQDPNELDNLIEQMETDPFTPTAVGTEEDFGSNSEQDIPDPTQVGFDRLYEELGREPTDKELAAFFCEGEEHE